MADKHHEVTNQTRHVCNIEGCGKIFSRPNRLLYHQNTHTGKRPYECDAEGCEKSYCRKTHLDRHIENAHLRKSDLQILKFRCKVDGCVSAFTLAHNLSKHVKQLHCEEAQQKYKCEVEGCHASFHKKHQLRSHTFSHKGVEPLKCTHPLCLRSFKTKQHLLRHLKVHQGYNCDVKDCERHCQTWSELRAHKKKDHVEAHRCVDCGQTFLKRHLLNVHSHNVHQQRAPIACPVTDCDRLYWDRRNLNHHNKIKHLKLCYRCTADGCQESRASQKRLNEHIKHAHLGQSSSSSCTKSEDTKKKKKGRKKKSFVEKLTGIKSDVTMEHQFIPVAISNKSHQDLEWKNITDSANFVDFAARHVEGLFTVHDKKEVSDGVPKVIDVGTDIDRDSDVAQIFTDRFL